MSQNFQQGALRSSLTVAKKEGEKEEEKKPTALDRKKASGRGERGGNGPGGVLSSGGGKGPSKKNKKKRGKRHLVHEGEKSKGTESARRQEKKRRKRHQRPCICGRKRATIFTKKKGERARSFRKGRGGHEKGAKQVGKPGFPYNERSPNTVRGRKRKRGPEKGKKEGTFPFEKGERGVMFPNYKKRERKREGKEIYPLYQRARSTRKGDKKNGEGEEEVFSTFF